MASVFVYGSLRHRPLLDMILGAARDVRIDSARLPEHGVYWVKDEAFPIIVEQPGVVAEGLYINGLDADDLKRLDFYEGGFDYALVTVTVETGQGPRKAQAYFPQAGRWAVGEPWSLADWQRDWAAISLRAASEAMGLFGQISAADLARWLPQIRVRAASWVRAQSQLSPMALRRGLTAGEVKVENSARPYRKFFAIDEHLLRYRRFDGNMSAPVSLAAFVSGDAVTVLPYDPVRDRVMLIEQFRLGPFVRGDTHPWSLEPIAGRIDPGELPEDAARREAIEETGLILQGLEQIARYYPTPGAATEYLFSYVAVADLPDDIAGLGGEESEVEDIRSLLLSFDELQDLLASGEAENGPLIMSALWLAAHRSRLRGDA